MDLRALTEPRPADATEPAQAVLAEVTCSWGEDLNVAEQTALVVHAARSMLVLERSQPRHPLPPLGTYMRVSGDIAGDLSGRLAEEGRAGRFLISLGDRPVRRVARLRVSLAGILRSPTLSQPTSVEIVDLTTGGARLRGVEIPVDSHVTFEFTPPGRNHPVTVRGVVAHSSYQAEQPWIGVVFRLVAMRGGRDTESPVES